MNKNTPDLTLNMDEKIYLALDKESTEKFAFVYTLACLQEKPNSASYNAMATHEIHAFKNKDSAEIYHDTIERIIERNMVSENKKIFFDANEKQIEQFYENTR